MGSDESLDFLGDTEVEELEPLVDLDEDGEEEAELFDSFEELVEVRLPVDGTLELCLSLTLEDCLVEDEL